MFSKNGKDSDAKVVSVAVCRLPKRLDKRDESGMFSNLRVLRELRGKALLACVTSINQQQE
jgi:hypothetical protein